MNSLINYRKILLLITFVNLFIVLFFPPFDDVSLSNHGVAVFFGFMPYFASSKTMMINTALMYLEVMIVLINLCVMWMMTGESSVYFKSARLVNIRKLSMLIIVANLIVVLLFPPFQYISNINNAVIPSFEGFYFIFSHPPYRYIVMQILYIEVTAILVNGCLFLLAFRGNRFNLKVF